MIHRILAATLSALVVSLTSCGSDPNRPGPPVSPAGGGKPTLLLFHNELDGFDFESDQELNDIVWQNYALKRVRLSAPYDELFLRRHFTSMQASGRYRRNLDFEDYLAIKNEPLDEHSLSSIRRYGLSQTPELVVVSPDGRVLDHYTRHHSEIAFREYIKQASELGPERLNALLWSLRNENDRASLKAFLVRNARSPQS